MSQKLYKLTDQDGQTRNHTQWGENVTHSGTGKAELCTDGVIHAYEDQNIGLFMNPIQAGFKNPRLWECSGEVAVRDHQLKCGCFTLTTIRELEIPPISTDQRVAFAIWCALKVCDDANFNQWCENWISGTDRSLGAAAEARAAARAAEINNLDLFAIAQRAIEWKDQ